MNFKMGRLFILFTALLMNFSVKAQTGGHTALLVMDMQESILKMTNTGGVIGKVSEAIAAARKNNIPVIYLTAGFRKGAPEISALNKYFSTHRQTFAQADPKEWMRIDRRITPQDTDIIIEKRRVGAFLGSELEVICRVKNIQHLVLTSVATNGVVLSTVRDAADRDYQITVLSDGCADPDPEVQRVLMTKVLPVQAEF